MQAITVAITLAHTFDEVSSAGGPIWEYLKRLVPLPTLALMPGYIVFQAVVLLLGIFAASEDPIRIVMVSFVSVRLADVIFTHNVLRWLRSPNPGFRTSWLLLIDAALVGARLIWTD